MLVVGLDFPACFDEVHLVVGARDNFDWIVAVGDRRESLGLDAWLFHRALNDNI